MKRLIRVVRTTPGPAHSHRQSAALIAPSETLATLWKPVGATELPRGPSSLVLLSCMHHSAHPSIISPSVSAICSNAVRGFSHASCRVVATEGETPGTCRYLTTTHQASAILDSPASPPTPAPQRSSAASTTQGTTQSLSSDSSGKDPEEEGANTHGFAYWLEIALRSRRAAKRGREQRDPKISPTGGFKNGPTLKGKGSESVTGSIDPASSRHSTQQRHNGLLGLATHPQADSSQPQYTDGTHRNWSETKGGDPFPANKSSSGRGGGKGDGYPTTGGSSGDSRGHEGGGGMASVAGGSGGGSGGGGNEGGGGGTRPVQDSPVEPPLQGTVWKQIIDEARVDKGKLERTVSMLHTHCMQTLQHPPVVAFNALLDACTKSGNMELVHTMIQILDRTGMQPNENTQMKLSEAFAYNNRIRT